MRGDRRFFLTVVLTYLEGPVELENPHLASVIVNPDLEKNQPWMLQL